MEYPKTGKRSRFAIGVLFLVRETIILTVKCLKLILIILLNVECFYFTG